MPINQFVQENSPINPSVDALKSRLSANGSLLRQHNFKVNVPKCSVEENRELNDILQDVSLPSKTHATQPVYYGGPLRNIPYITTYPGTITLTMICTEESRVRNRFYDWLETVVSGTNGLVNYASEYLGDQMEITVVNNPKKIPTGPSNEAIKYTLFDVFPDSINEVTLSQNSQNDYLRLSVVMMYRKWIKGELPDQPLDTNDLIFPGGPLRLA